MFQIQLRQWANYHPIRLFVGFTYLLFWGIWLPTPSATFASPLTQIPQLETATSSFPSDRHIISQADAYLSKLTKAKLFSGSVLLERNGKVLVRKGYGKADREKHLVNTPQTKFRIGSLTKQFTAMAILILQARGKLNVQDRICFYLSECPATWQKITLHHLLTHTSGIPDFISFPDFKTTQGSPSSPTQTIARFKNRWLSSQGKSLATATPATLCWVPSSNRHQVKDMRHSYRRISLSRCRWWTQATTTTTAISRSGIGIKQTWLISLICLSPTLLAACTPPWKTSTVGIGHCTQIN